MTVRPAERVRTLLFRPAVLYALLTPFAFAILEMLLFRTKGVQYALDVFDSDLPVLAALRADWIRFGPSLWNPHLTSGNASMVQMALPPSTPDFLLSFLLPLFVAYFLCYAALIWLAGLGMHLFLRDSMRLGTAACVLGAILYQFSFWHYIHGFAVPLVPLMLWLTDRWVNASRHRWRLGMALVAIGTFQAYAGLVQLTAIVALVQLVYLLVLYRRSGRIRRIAAGWLGIWSACVLLFAPVAATLLVAIGGSHRSVWHTGPATDAGLASIARSTVSLFGNAIGAVPIEGLVTGSGEYAGTYFVGVVAFLFLVVGLFRPRDARGRLLLGALAGVPILYLVAVLAAPLQTHLGPLKSFQLVRISHLFPFVLAANAAIGADAVISGEWRTFYRGRARFAALAGLLVLFGAEAVYSLARAVLADAGQREATGWLLATLALGGGVLLGAWLLIRSRHSATPLPIGTAVLIMLLLATVGERAIYARAERYLHGGLGTYAAAMHVDAGFAFIREQAGTAFGRTLTAGQPSNRAVISGRDDAGGYQSIYPLGYHQLFGVLTEPFLETNKHYSWYFHYWGNRAFPFGPGLNYPVADLMGIRWIWARNMPFEDPRLIERFRSGDITVYENTAAFPHAFVVGRVRAFPSQQALLDGLAAADDSQLRDSVLVLAGPGAPPSMAPTDTQDAKAEVTSSTPDRVDIQVDAPSPAVLVLTDTFAPGWTATVCGAPSAIYLADNAYRAVAVPAGSCPVTFRYQPWFTYAGFMAALATLLLLASVALVCVRRDRRADAAARSPGDGPA